MKELALSRTMPPFSCAARWLHVTAGWRRWCWRIVSSSKISTRANSVWSLRSCMTRVMETEASRTRPERPSLIWSFWPRGFNGTFTSMYIYIWLIEWCRTILILPENWGCSLNLYTRKGGKAFWNWDNMGNVQADHSAAGTKHYDSKRVKMKHLVMFHRDMRWCCETCLND